MKALFKVAMCLLAVVYIKSRFLDRNLYKEGLLPMTLGFAQGPSPRENQPLLIEFWATSCDTCKQSVPHVNELYSQYNSQGLSVVAITNEDPALVEKCMRSFAMEYPVAFDPKSRYFDAFHVGPIPHAFLIDRAGKIVWDGHPMNIKASQIEKLVAAE